MSYLIVCTKYIFIVSVRNSPESISEIHVLGSVSFPEKAAKLLLDQANPKALVLDFSSGQLLTPHRLEKRVDIPEEIRWINGQAYADQYGDSSREEYIEWLARQADEPLIEDTSIKELFTYKGEISLWWFTPMAEKHSQNHPFRWLFYMIAVLRRIRETYETNTWHVWTDDKKEAKVLDSFLNREADVHVHSLVEEISGGIFQKFWDSIKGSKISYLLKSIVLLVRQSVKSILAVWHLRNGELGESRGEESWNSEYEVLVQTSFPHSWIEDTNESQFDSDVEVYDRYFGKAPWDLNSSDLKVAWMPTLHTRSQIQKWAETRHRQTLPDVGKALRISWWTVFRLLVEAWRWWGTFLWSFEVRKSHRRWTYENLDLGAYLHREMWSLVTGDGLRYAQRIEQYQSACEDVQPKVVLYRDEFYRSGRAVAAGLKERTKRVGVQHGLIGNEHTVYQIHEAEVQPVSDSPPDYIRYNPVPDAFACFGRETKRLFEEWRGYPHERVWVTGGLRHDHIYKTYGDFSDAETAKLRQDLGLPQDRKVVLLCTGLRSEVDDWLRMTIEAIQRQRSTAPVLAIKLHPYHGGEEIVLNRCRKMKFKDYQLYRKPMYPVMAASDVVVGGASTVILEAGLLGVPSLVFTTGGNYGHYDFESGELGIEVKDVEQMRHALRRSLREGKRKSESGRHMANVGGDNSVEKVYRKIIQ